MRGARKQLSASDQDRHVVPATRVAVGLLVVLIVYGSLYPFDWNVNAHKGLLYWNRVSLSDLVQNVLLFLPLGWLLGSIANQRGRHAQPGVALLHFCWGVGIAVGVQILQVYIPERVPAFSDAFFNMMGWLIGWCLARSAPFSALFPNVLKKRPLQLHQPAIVWVLVCLWAASELFPFIPTIDVALLREKAKILLFGSWLDTKRLLMHGAQCYAMLAVLRVTLMQTFAGARLWLSSAAVVLFLLGAKLLVIGQYPTPAVVLGTVAGAVLCMMQPARMRALLTGGLCAALLAFMAYQWLPLQFDMNGATHFAWLPFGSWLRGDAINAVQTAAFFVFCFVTFLWCARRLGGQLFPLTFILFLLTLLSEWVQLFLVGRTADTTPAGLVILAAIVAAFSDPDEQSKRSI
jgi:VanZ family protein